VFTPSDFLDLAERAAVDQALSRLARNGKLRRRARGLYVLPKIHPRLGPLSPDPDHVARALARETGSKVQIAGARAAHLLGLTPQVPGQSDYLTDGPSTRAGDVVRIAARSLSAADKKRLGVSVRRAPAWMQRMLLTIAAVEFDPR